MSDTFFKDLRLPEPHLHLGIGSGGHGEQTGKVIIAYEKILFRERPDLVIVVGDVNSTMAATIAAVKLGISVGHLEAGLRSFDRSMPEEINRVVTDALCDVLWTPSYDGDKNLLKEGISPEKIHRVGNIMIDSLEMMRRKIEKEAIYKKFGLNPGEFGVITFHRPSNVDEPDILKSLCECLSRISLRLPLVFPLHPRTRKNLERFGLTHLLDKNNGLRVLEPLGYIQFMNLIFNCRLAITDSGGIQEETTYLGVPCLTLRPNTERPITIEKGTNRLCTLKNLEADVKEILDGNNRDYEVPEYWDGQTAKRVVGSIGKILGKDF